jgi:hypothetical protein
MKKNTPLIMFLCIMGLYSCRKNNGTVTNPNVNVYVAGTDEDGTHDGNPLNNNIDIAKYWKNGKVVNLTDGSDKAYVYSIAVSGNDVYVAGTEAPGGLNDVLATAKYWKNGIPVNLTDGSDWGIACSIAVSGNDV